MAVNDYLAWLNRLASWRVNRLMWHSDRVERYVGLDRGLGLASSKVRDPDGLRIDLVAELSVNPNGIAVRGRRARHQ
jgi:hypothetical protein